MTFFYLEALAGMTLALAILMSLAWIVQQRTGNSGWVDTIWTFSVGVVGGAGALWPLAGSSPNARQWLVAALVATWSLRLGLHVAIRSAGISDDPPLCRVRDGMGQRCAAPDVPVPAGPGVRIDSAGVCDFRRRACPDRCAAAAGLSRRAGPADSHRRRGTGGRPAEGLPHRSRQQGAGVQRRSLELVAPSQLFLRVAGLARLSRDRAVASLSLGLGQPAGPRLHVLDPGPRHRHPTLEEQMLRSRASAIAAAVARHRFFPLPPHKGVVS